MRRSAFTPANPRASQLLDNGGTGALKLVAQLLLNGKADAVLAANVFEFGECTVRDAEESRAKKGIPVRS
jgi:imidazole glycerol phosphate synthase subunit HisF